jgi:peptidoglycan/xylan/chitin deacetylase (PgdA/CDA1 family)
MKPAARLLPWLLLFLAWADVALPANPIPNPGFEEGDQGWAIRDSMSKVVPESAHEGKLGLKIVDEDAKNGSSVMSAKLPVQAGQEITLTFWARAQADCSGVNLWFFNSAGQIVKSPDPKWRYSQGSPAVGIKKGAGEWMPYTLKVQAPEGAVRVAIWIHTWSTATGTVECDDFAIEGLADGAVPEMPAAAPPRPAQPSAAAPAATPNFPPRKSPPMVVIKADDLRQIDGKVNGLWTRFADFIKSRNLKAGIGMTCETLEAATPEYVRWIKDQRAAGNIEFWFHGWDHKTWDNQGKTMNEFCGRSYEEQKERFERSQKLALEKLGFAFQAFGPPGGAMSASFDANTLRVMADDPNMKAMLYPTPFDEPGRKLDAQGKVAVLDRVWEVNLESKVGLPDYDKFVAGYAKHPERAYFVLQGHPMHWAAERFQEFTRIVDFLMEQKAVFMTPSECAAAVVAARGPPSPR